VGTLLIICTSKIRWTVMPYGAFLCKKVLQFQCIFFES